MRLYDSCSFLGSRPGKRDLLCYVEGISFYIADKEGITYDEWR